MPLVISIPLYLEFSDEFFHRVFVDDSLVLDFLSPVSIAKCGQCLIVIDVCRGQGSDHDGFAENQSSHLLESLLLHYNEAEL